MKKRKRKIIRVGFRGKKFILRNYLVCDNYFSKARGLMFRSRNFKTPLVFIFNKKKKYPIHSLFCRKFLALWLADGKIIEKRVVEPWKFSVIPAEKFDTLIEIPM